MGQVHIVPMNRCLLTGHGRTCIGSSIRRGTSSTNPS